MAKVTKIQSAVTGDEYQVQNLDVQQSTGQSTKAVMSQKAITDALATKQGTISDLQTIRSGAAAGATAYQKPSSGIPSSDMASGVQTSLGKADTAIQPGNVKQTTGESTGDIMSQKAVTDELDKKANKDGYYETMSVGSADNLTGQNADTATWEERPVGGEGAEVATGLASVQAVGGNGCAWNQLVQNGDFSNGTTNWGINGSEDVSVSDGIISFTPRSQYQGITQELNGLVSGHKYLVCASVYQGTNTNAYVNGNFLGTNIIGGIASVGVWETEKMLITAGNNPSIHSIGVGSTASSDFAEIKVKNIYVIDLTLLGINNLTTVAEVEAWLTTHISTKPYYPYNAGTLLPAKLQGYKTTGKSANLLNPATRTARLFAYTWPDHNNMFTIKELPSGLTLTFTPDATGVAETIEPNSTTGHFSVSGSGNLAVSGSADLSATWLIATWDESMDDYDNFEAWDGKSYAFDTSKIYGKLNGAGDYVQVFPNGMRGAGSARDILNLAKAEAVKNVESVDLGSLSWEGTTLIRATVFGLRDRGDRALGVNLLCSKYIPTQATQWGDISDYEIGAISSQIRLKDPSHQSAPTSSDNWLSGVTLYYELATPLVYTDCVYRDNGVDTPLSELNILVNNWAYEQAAVAQQADAFSTEKAYAIGDYVTYSSTQYRFTAAKTAGSWDSTKVTADASPVSCAAQSTILYGIDAVQQLDTLKETGIDIDAMRSNLDAMLTAMQTAGIIGGYTLGATPTNKVFSITITAPTPAE